MARTTCRCWCLDHAHDWGVGFCRSARPVTQEHLDRGIYAWAGRRPVTLGDPPVLTDIHQRKQDD